MHTRLRPHALLDHLILVALRVPLEMFLPCKRPNSTGEILRSNGPPDLCTHFSQASDVINKSTKSLKNVYLASVSRNSVSIRRRLDLLLPLPFPLLLDGMAYSKVTVSRSV